MSYRSHHYRVKSQIIGLILSMFCLLGTFDVAASSASSTSAQFPVVVHAVNGDVTIASKPTRIISLSPTATEDLFAIGAGSSVIAVDNDSDYPKSAPKTSLSGYTPNIEAVEHYHPDLVVVVGDEGGLVAALQKVDIPVIVQPAPANLTGVYGEISALGVATGLRHQAQALIATMRAKISAVVNSAPTFAKHQSYYAELDPTFYSVTSKTLLGSIFSLFGLKNIADRASGAASGYPQLSSEYIVSANPNLVFLADTICCGQSAKSVKLRAGWSTMTAVKRGDVIGLSDDIASRWGPRVVILAQQIEKALVKLSSRS